MTLKSIKTHKTLIELVKYGLIGGSNVLINLIILNVLSYLTGIYSGPTMYIFYGISFIVYSINGYFWNKKFTFSSNNGSYFKYASILGISTFLNSTLCTIFTTFNIFNFQEILWMNISIILSSITVGILTFILNKCFVFRNRTE
ncbi:GtrA family protein [Clostridium sp.]|uniref:GtrA family protein n=1 Tax=Clostridium sp. TaxID=1506 RepID=UPI0039F5FB85